MARPAGHISNPSPSIQKAVVRSRSLESGAFTSSSSVFISSNCVVLVIGDIGSLLGMPYNL